MPRALYNLLAVTLMTTLPPVVTAEMRGEVVTYEVAGKTHEGYFARNTALGDEQPVVVLIHDWDGLDSYEQRRADMLAGLGYAAFAIDLYGQGVRPQALEEKRARTRELYGDREEMRRRMAGALSHLPTLDGVDPDRIVIGGYCFGGAAALELARSGVAAEGFVIFHGGLGTPDGQDYTDVTAPVLVLHGSADDSVPMSEVAELAEALDRDGVEHTMEIYGGAPHAFTVWGGERYRGSADLRSWATFTAFLRERLH